MKTGQIKCPCCGQPDDSPRQVRVSLEQNLLWFGEHEVKLTRRLAELAFILAKRMPASVPHGTIASQMWGDVGTDWSDTNIKVGVSQLRKLLRPIGVHILNTHGVGYSMVVVPPMSRTERAIQPRKAAHAQA